MPVPVREMTSAAEVMASAQRQRAVAFGARPVVPVVLPKMARALAGGPQHDCHVTAYQTRVKALLFDRRYNAHVLLWRQQASSEVTTFRVRQIVELTSMATGIPVADILSARRSHPVTHARQIAYWLARRFSLRSLPDIGRRIGNRDHSTILHGARRVESMIADQRIAPAEHNDPYHWALALWVADWSGSPARGGRS